MSKLLIGAVVAAAIVGAGAAVAQGAPNSPQGKAVHQARMAAPMTRPSVQAHVQQMFAHVDANRDGFITQAEAGAVKQRMHADKGQRTERGARPARAQRFDRIDGNRDGVISREEFAAAPQGQRAMRGARMHRGMTGMGGMGARMFERADANKDGRVSLAEAQTAALAHFDRRDLNRDGTLTREERRQSRQQMRATRRAG